MTLEQLIALLEAMKTEENKDYKIILYTGYEIEATTILDNQECITIY